MITTEEIICGTRQEILDYFKPLVADNKYEYEYAKGGFIKSGLKKWSAEAEYAGMEIRDTIKYFCMGSKSSIESQIEQMYKTNDRRFMSMIFLMTSEYIREDDEFLPELNLTLEGINIKIRPDEGFRLSDLLNK